MWPKLVLRNLMLKLEPPASEKTNYEKLGQLSPPPNNISSGLPWQSFVISIKAASTQDLWLVISCREQMLVAVRGNLTFLDLGWGRMEKECWTGAEWYLQPSSYGLAVSCLHPLAAEVTVCHSANHHDWSPWKCWLTSGQHISLSKMNW